MSAVPTLFMFMFVFMFMFMLMASTPIRGPNVLESVQRYLIPFSLVYLRFLPPSAKYLILSHCTTADLPSRYIH